MSERPWPLVVRVARPDDHDAVMRFATTTWDGWDYMPRAWPRWLVAEDGIMLVGCVGGRGGKDADGSELVAGDVVAVVRVAMPATGEAWLEGIRVDPRVRGMDVATDLQVAELRWAAANGATVVRYATSARNEGSHRLGARGGFEQIASLLSTSWQPPQDENVTSHGDHNESGFDERVQAEAQQRRRVLLDRLAKDGVIAAPGGFDRIWRGVSGDETFNAMRRLYEPRSWALEELTEAKFRDHLSAGEVLHGTNGDGGKAVGIIVADVPPAEEATLRMALLVGTPTAAFELLERARQTANESIRFRYPIDSPLVDSIRTRYVSAGYEMSDWALHILSRPIDEAHPAPEIDADALVLEDEPDAVITPAR